MLLYEIIIFGFLIALAVNRQALCQDSSEISDRIVNGKDVKIGERPFQVSLTNPKHFCGGTIINKRYILTAAHCLVYKEASDLGVVVGTVDLKKPYKTYTASKIIIHKEYSPKNSFKNDIALLKVSSPITFSNRVRPAKILKSNAPIKPGTLVIVSGWGRLENGSLPNILQEIVLEVTDQQKCRKIVNRDEYTIFNSQLCADDNDPSVRSGDCNGDSGGPLTDTNGNLVGIVSWSIKDPSCGSKDYPNVYTRVSSYIDWITRNMN